MSSELLKIEKDLCRCCHSEGSFKNLSEPRITTGLPNIYADMLKECYDIDMAPVPGLLCMATYTICEACIIRLQDAVDFKEQVLKCEERFKEMFNTNSISVGFTTVAVEVKQEFPDSDDDRDGLVIDQDGDDKSMDLIINEDEDVDDDKPLKEEVGKKRKHKTKKAVKSKTCKETISQKAQETADEIIDAEKKKGRVEAPIFRLKENEDFRKKGDMFECVRCDKLSKSYAAVRYHVRSRHYNILKFKCSICQERFQLLRQIILHKLEVHKIDERFKCAVCSKIYNNRTQFLKHIHNFHKLGAKLKCESCDYVAYSVPALYKHKIKHKTVKDFHCRFCTKSFLRKTTLDFHERIHTGDKRKVCIVCGQAFVQKASLNHHMAKYHPGVKFS